jgi:arsenate reductase
MVKPSGYTLYHNPRCGTSRQVLAALQAAGQPLQVVDYLKTPPSRATLRQLASDCGVGVRGLLRSKEKLYTELGLEQPALTDEHLLDAIEAHPILLNRPIVAGPKGTALCRPAERVQELL